MSQYECSKRWKEKNREKVNKNQQRYRKENGKKIYKKTYKKRLNKIIEWYKNYKEKLCCEKCGESHFACIAFHHRNPEEKEIDILRKINLIGISQ